MKSTAFRSILGTTFVSLLVGCATPHVAPKHPTYVAARSLREARSRFDDTADRIAHYLEAARESAALLGKGGETAGRALTIYNDACTELALLLYSTEDGRWRAGTAKVDRYELRIARAAKGVWAPDYFTELLPTRAVNEDLVRNPVKRSGVGGVLVGVRKTKSSREEFIPRVGVAGPVTATVVFAGNEATLALRNPTDATVVGIDGRRYVLAADFSAPLCYYPNVNANVFGFIEALNPEKYEDLAGLYFLEPYDPKRIPVIYVHGLVSSPYMWRDVINEVNADPELRDRYQALVFAYPSGNPFALSAGHFREALAVFEQKYPLPHGYVLVSHSMGGLLSRMQAQTITRNDWRAVLGPEADKLFENESYGPMLRNLGLFESNPDVERIVFICTPHRGAKMADALLGRIGRSLIRVPSTIVGTLVSAPKDEMSLFTGESGEMPTSISSLAPENVCFEVLNAEEVEPPVNTIVGTGWWGHEPLAKSSDGVVAYWSSHLDYAESEIAVPDRHTFVPDHPKATAELRRILGVHLEGLE